MAANMSTLLFCLVVSGIMTAFIMDYSQTQAVRCSESMNATALYSSIPNLTEPDDYQQYTRSLYSECSEGIPWWVYLIAITPAALGLGVYFIPFVG